jgi:hypothetical protein
MKRQEYAAACCQCRVNLATAFSFHGLTPPLLVMVARPDRCFYYPDAEFIAQLAALPAFVPWALGIEAHTDPSAGTALRGWREDRVTCSMQVIEHTGAIEADIDEWNPERGAVPGLLHFGEVLRNALLRRKSDQFRIARKLEARRKELKDASWPA